MKPPAGRRRLLLTACLVALLLVGIDLARPPAAQLTARGLLAAIDLYQATLSRRTGIRCRFEPTCSLYGEAVIRREGALAGGLKAAWRVLRCGPWTPVGTSDPPPGGPARAGLLPGSRSGAAGQCDGAPEQSSTARSRLD